MNKVRLYGPSVFFPALLLTLNAFTCLADGQNGTQSATTTVNANPAAITVGGSVGLTATVQPNKVVSSPAPIFSRPSGTITFLDGTTPLRTAPAALVPSGFVRATFQQTFGTPDPSLTAETVSSVEGQLTGDLNGDGVPDLLIYAYLPGFSERTFTRNGKGGYTTGAVQTLTFPVVASYPNVTNLPQLIDVNGDGKLDLLSGLQVAYGNGDGTFAPAVPVPFLSSGFVTSYAADLNGDGKTDILAVDVIQGNPFLGASIQFAVTAFLNQGGGSFTSAGTFPVAPPTSGAFVAVNFFAPAFVDLNGDGKPDLIVQTQPVGQTQIGGDPDVEVLLNNGNGTFGNPLKVTVPDPPNNTDNFTAYGTGSGDVNGDGKQDIILTIADIAGNVDAITLLGNGDGTFQSPLYLTMQTGPGIPYFQTPAVVVQDFNLDGKLDPILGDGQLALGNGNGTFVLSSPLFPPQSVGQAYLALPLEQIELPGNLVPSLVYLLPSATPPPAAVFTPQTSSSAALSLATLAVGTHTVSARYSGDANYAADTSAGIAVTVNQAASATAASSSANPSFAGQSVTLTADVTSAGPAPTGNVIFASGSTTLATVALSGGSAAYTTSSFDTVGTQMITASYSGDANTAASSAALSQVVNAAVVLVPGGSGGTTLTVQSGQTGSVPINVTGAAGFSGTITFACSGLPANASCSFSPASITVSGTSAVSTSLSVNTAASTTTSPLRQHPDTGPGTVAFGLGLAGLALFWPIRRKGGRLWAMLACTLAFTALGLTGCGGGGSGPAAAKTAPGSYNFTVAASSGSMMQSQSSFTLVVQ